MSHILPQEIIKGLDLINNGKYYQAHEVLERAWMLEPEDIRQLYQGLIQLSVALFHLDQGNVKGSLKLIPKAKINISRYENMDILIDLKKLISDLNLLQHDLLNEIDNPANPKIHGPIVIMRRPD